eukprot:11855679-Alexandrium_andersonii.AAC.1
MSASLVGSEMCIRDSREGDWCAQVPAPPEEPLKPEPVPPIPVADAKAVSYTHLTLPTICSV